MGVEDRPIPDPDRPISLEQMAEDIEELFELQAISDKLSRVVGRKGSDLQFRHGITRDGEPFIIRSANSNLDVVDEDDYVAEDQETFEATRIMGVGKTGVHGDFVVEFYNEVTRSTCRLNSFDGVSFEPVAANDPNNLETS